MAKLQSFENLHFCILIRLHEVVIKSTIYQTYFRTLGTRQEVLAYDEAEQNQRKRLFFHITVSKNMHINKRKHNDIYLLRNTLLI